MPEEATKSAALKPFVVGLVIGLAVGGLAGAYLGGLSEGPKLRQPAGKAAPAPTGPRDVRPTDQPAPTGEAPTPAPEKPADPK